MVEKDFAAVGRQTEDQIKVLEGLEAVRMRPGMYVGGKDSRALHHLIYEVVDNSIDEALAGRCDHIVVTIYPDNYVSIGDNGGGIPVGLNKDKNISTLELVMTNLHAGGKFGSGAYKVSGGLHGVGVSAVNALSEELTAQVFRDGHVWQQSYRAGRPQTPVEPVRPLEPGEGTGTLITFRPDYTVMEHNDFNYATLAQRFREMAFVTRKVRITLRDEREFPLPKETTFYFEGGLLSFVRYMNRNREALHAVVSAEREIEITPENEAPYTVGIEFAFQYTDAATVTELAFANTINTPDGGTHLTGMRSAVTGMINRFARKAGFLKDKDSNFSGSDTLEGITAIVSIKHPNPSFESQTKVKLLNPELQGAVSQVVTEAFGEFLELNPREARRIIEKCMTSMRAREAARKARDLVRSGPSLLESSTLPGKLADCSQHGENAEIYIVEGDSAGGCFSGDTKVALADGRSLSFEELVAEQAEGKEHFCYTIRADGTVGLERAINARVTRRNAEVIRVTLDNGEVITCTPDHRFMLRDGSYKAAELLAAGESLMPLYRKLSDKSEAGITIDGYEMTWDPRSETWLFTHVLADWYNRWNGIYTRESGDHCHHVDFNKRNNNPTNIRRMAASDHLALHRLYVKRTLHRSDSIEKWRKRRGSDEYRRMMSERMRQPETRAVLSEQAKAQWANDEYKSYMLAKWRAYYAENEAYRRANREMLIRAQAEYWGDAKHREEQAQRVRAYFEQHPEARSFASERSQLQWQDESLIEWRRQKTSQQWTPEFREQRKSALRETYYQKTIGALKQVELELGYLDIITYNERRVASRDKSLLRFDTFCQRYFDGDVQRASEAVANYNHRVVSVERVQERMDVYDIEVPNTHNFALASGVFVHNSAKQGRDRHFQAILPLRGKILNTERARLDKMLDNNEIKALISALGTGIGEDFEVSSLRYGRVVVMSVAGDEPTLVMDNQGQTEFVQIGSFIDECIEGQRDPANYQVMCFDLNTHETRFRPLKAVIRHGHEEAMYSLRTRYNRSVKVTSSHSIFVYENGQVRLKKGSEVRPGDMLVASRRLPRPASSPTRIDLLTTFYQAEQGESLYVRGEDVRQVAAQRTLQRTKRPDLWSEPRVSVSPDGWQSLVAQREAQGLSQMRVAQAIGVKQPITISQWERGIYRPIESQFRDYLQTIQWDQNLDYLLIPSKIDERLSQDDLSKNARWRQVSNYKPLSEFTPGELECLGDGVELVPQAHQEKGFSRYLPISRELVWLLGWFVAEGTLSKHQVSFNLGAKDTKFIPEIVAAVQAVFGETPRQYNAPDSKGTKLYFHSVAAARLLQSWGLAERAHMKKLPDILFSLPEDLQLAFLESYFLGDGTTQGENLSFTTNSPLLKDGLLYLMGQLGLVVSCTRHEPSQPSDANIVTRHPYFTLAICGKAQLERCRAVWQRHANASKVEEHIARPGRKAADYVSISDDLIGLEVLSAEEIEPVGQYVYDFSVQDDENFICGTGGLCAHNTDADVDGSHIRTLLLTFFFRHMQPLIQEGHLYIAQPPLFRIQNGKEFEYFYPEAGLGENEILARAVKRFPDPEKLKISRYKGLGEMNPEQLWETTMDPARRTLLQVTIEDAAEADRVFDMLMGTSVPERRRFIQSHAKNVRNLDV